MEAVAAVAATVFVVACVIGLVVAVRSLLADDAYPETERRTRREDSDDE